MRREVRGVKFKIDHPRCGIVRMVSHSDVNN